MVFWMTASWVRAVICAGRVADPGEESALGGVVEGVFGDESRWWRTGLDGGVAELELLRGGEAEAKAGFGSGVGEVGYVGGLPGLGEVVFGVVDAVLLAHMEAGRGEGETAVGWSPVGPGLVAPGGLRLEVGVADGGGVRVVEVEIGGEAEAVAYGGAEAEGVGESERCRGVGGEDGFAAGEDLLAGSQRQREAA